MRLAEVNPFPALLTIGPRNRDHEVSIRVVVTVLVPLAVLYAIGRMDLSVYAVFAGFTGIYGRNEHHADRVRTQLKAGALMFAVLTLASFANAAGLTEARNPWGLVVATSLVAGVAAVITGVWKLRPTGSLFHIFAFAAVASAPVSPPRGAALLTAAVVILWAVGVGLSSRVARSRRVPLNEPTTTHITTLPNMPVILWEGAWHLIAAAIAGSVATLLSDGQAHHNYWAMVAAVTPLVGHSTRHRVNRGFQRVIGTVVGLGLTWLIIVADPGAFVVLLLVVALQGAAELIVARHYALAQVVVTPLALLSGMLVVLTVGGKPTLQAAGGLQMISDRAVETVIGSVVGVACVLTPWLTRRYVFQRADPGVSRLGTGRRRPPHPMSFRG